MQRKAADDARAEMEAAHVASQRDLAAAEARWKSAEDARFSEAEAQWAEQKSNEIASARANWQRHHLSTLAQAEGHWQAAENSRFATAAALWAEQKAKAVADTRAQVAAEHEQRYGPEMTRLRTDLASMQTAFAARELELREAQSLAVRQRDRLEQETALVLAEAETSWKSREIARLTTAREQWQAEMKRAVAQARSEAVTVESGASNIELRRLRDEYTSLKATLAAREVELSRLRDAAATDEDEDGRVVLNRNWNPNTVRRRAEREAERRRLIKRRVIWASAAAAGLIICSFAFQSRIQPLVSKVGKQAIVLIRPPAPANSPSPPPAQIGAVVARAVNVRSAPSGQAEILITLQAGIQVTPLDHVGNWVHIRFNAGNGKPEQQEGWVYSSFLKQPGGPEKSPPAAQHASLPAAPAPDHRPVPAVTAAPAVTTARAVPAAPAVPVTRAEPIAPAAPSVPATPTVAATPAATPATTKSATAGETTAPP